MIGTPLDILWDLIQILIAAKAALQRKKTSEADLDRLAGTRLQLEMQVNTLESANLNAETMGAMKKASEAMKVIHGNMYVLTSHLHHCISVTDEIRWAYRTIDQVDATMADVHEQRAIADEIANAISNPGGQDMDSDVSHPTNSACMNALTYSRRIL